MGECSFKRTIPALFTLAQFVLLQSDRHLEFHVQHGAYYRTRIPTFGRDLAYHYPSCDLYITAAGSVSITLHHCLAVPATGPNVSVSVGTRSTD